MNATTDIPWKKLVRLILPTVSRGMTVLTVIFLLIIDCGLSHAKSLEEMPVCHNEAGKNTWNRRSRVIAFKGIPYGENTAEARFLPPIAKKPWEGIRDATVFGMPHAQHN